MVKGTKGQKYGRYRTWSTRCLQERVPGPPGGLLRPGQRRERGQSLRGRVCHLRRRLRHRAEADATERPHCKYTAPDGE